MICQSCGYNPAAAIAMKWGMELYDSDFKIPMPDVEMTPNGQLMLIHKAHLAGCVVVSDLRADGSFMIHGLGKDIREALKN